MSDALVLIVEDERVVARDIERQLTRIGHRVAGIVAAGEDAVRLASETKPDLVLMDIRLEGAMDGISAAQAIRTEMRIPVLFLTAYADDETVQRATKAEPFGYLIKPFEQTQLRTAIEMAIYKHAAEQKLRESERRYATTLSSIGDAVIATDGQGRITFMNAVAEILTKWPTADAVGRPVTDVFRIINEDTRLTVEDPVAKVLKLGVIVGLANHTLLVARDGSEIAIDDSGAPIVNDQSEITGVVLVFRDISQKRQMDEALRQAQAELALVARLSRLGELAASIAHEVNQPLSAITTNAETCQNYIERAKSAAAQVLQSDSLTNERHIELKKEIVEALDAAGAAAERMAKNSHRAGGVVKSIRGLVTKSTSEHINLDLNRIIADVLDLLRGEIRRHGVSVETALSSQPLAVQGDRIQLQQVVFNLVMNAIESFSGVPQNDRRVMIVSRLAETGDALVSVEDSGFGLGSSDPEVIFEALFTTKREGMGLGLSICRSIVEAHKGKIWAASSTANATGALVSFEIPSSQQSETGL